jgi:hypothetical protein
VAFAGVRFRRRILGAECLADHEQKNELLHGVLYEDGTICGRLVALAATPRERDRAGCSIALFGGENRLIAVGKRTSRRSRI